MEGVHDLVTSYVKERAIKIINDAIIPLAVQKRGLAEKDIEKVINEQQKNLTKGPIISQINISDNLFEPVHESSIKALAKMPKVGSEEWKDGQFLSKWADELKKKLTPNQP